jgi:hypothetical protein
MLRQSFYEKAARAAERMGNIKLSQSLLKSLEKEKKRMQQLREELSGNKQDP